MKLTDEIIKKIIKSLFEVGIEEVESKYYRDEDGGYFEIIDSTYESFSEEAFNTEEGLKEWINEFTVCNIGKNKLLYSPIKDQLGFLKK